MATIKQIQENGNDISPVTETDAVLGLSEKLDEKADKTSLDSKADKSELETKADKSELESKADKTELDLKADKTELDLKANEVEVREHDTKINELHTRIGVAETNIKNNTDAISETTQRVNALKADVHEIDNTVSSLETEIQKKPDYSRTMREDNFSIVTLNTTLIVNFNHYINEESNEIVVATGLPAPAAGEPNAVITNTWDGRPVQVYINNSGELRAKLINSTAVFGESRVTGPYIYTRA